MHTNVARTAALALALALVAGSARAQIFSQPVYFQPTHGVGLTLAGDFAVGVNADAELSLDERPMAYGARITLGLPRVSITAGASAVNPRGGADTELAFGGNIELSLVNIPLMPVAVSALAGAGYVKFGSAGVPGSDVTVLDVPVGIGLGIKVPSPVLSVVPWLAPRIHYQRVEFAGLSESGFGYGASGGISLGLPTGLGFHAAFDWVSIDLDDDPLTDPLKPLRFGIGAHYKFSIPGLGVAGM